MRSRISSTGSSAQRAAVRRSCQTIARPIGAPLRLSQTSVVSRWFVIPIAASSPAPTPASARAAAAASTTVCQISSGVVLHQPGRREVLAELPVAASERLQRLVQDEARGAGCPLVDREEHR